MGFDVCVLGTYSFDPVQTPKSTPLSLVSSKHEQFSLFLFLFIFPSLLLLPSLPLPTPRSPFLPPPLSLGFLALFPGSWSSAQGGLGDSSKQRPSGYRCSSTKLESFWEVSSQRGLTR
eukprot:Lithocolla_globosa_v1_NODE_3664_length_1611_cov_4.287918.p3 type:complete len:118 gc:universal NODE_3664_length_1611_cov_4.287918:885-1238(+)